MFAIFIFLSPWRSCNSEAKILFLNHRRDEIGRKWLLKAEIYSGNQIYCKLLANHTWDHSECSKNTRYFPEGGSETEQFLNPCRIGLGNHMCLVKNILYYNKSKTIPLKGDVGSVIWVLLREWETLLISWTKYSASHLAEILYLWILIALRIWTFVSSSVKWWCWQYNPYVMSYLDTVLLVILSIP